MRGLYACDGAAIAAEQSDQGGVCEDAPTPCAKSVAQCFHCRARVGQELVNGALEFVGIGFGTRLQGNALVDEPVYAQAEVVNQRGAEGPIAMGLHFEPFAYG